MRLNRKVVGWIVSGLAVVVLAFGLGCDGGGGGGGEKVSTDTIAPSVFITSPTGSDGYSTKSSTIDLDGSASDNQGLSYITWSNNQGGSGTATGTTEWSISGISLQPGDNVITVTAHDSAGNIATDSITITYNSNLEFLSTLQLTPDSVFVNEPTTVVFRIALENNSNLDASTVKLLNVDSNNNIVGTITTLADDGNVDNGDDIASDGVFSGKASFTESVEGNIRLRVSAETIETTGRVTAYSEVLNLSVIAHLADAEFSKAVSMPDETQQKYDELKATYGEETAKTKTVEWLKTQPEVTEAGISESGNGIWYGLESGILGGILLHPEGTEGGRIGVTPKKPLVKQDLDYKSNQNLLTFGKSASKIGLLKALSSSTSKPTIGSKNILVIAPFNWQWKTSGAAFEESVYNMFANSICPTFNVTKIYDSSATVEVFKTLSNYGVVVLHTNGDAYFNQDLHSIWQGLDEIFATPWGKVVFLTGEKATETNKATYEVDLKKGRLAIIGGYYAITPAFVKYYNKSFPDSIIYNGSRRGMYNDSMSSAFIGNGVKTYFGFSEYVLSAYDNNIALTLFDSLVNKSKTTGEAFNDAISAHGTNDGSNPPAYFKMVGSKDLTVRGEGITNGTFEVGNINGWWTGQGDVRIISQLGPLSPQEGVYMCIISTGLGSINDSDSYVEQTLCIPAGVTTLSFDYNVVSEEPMEWVGTQYDDRFEATLNASGHTPDIYTPDINSSFYNDKNPYYLAGFGNQCTAFAWGRAYEKVGIKLTFSDGSQQTYPSGKYWIDQNTNGLLSGNIPRANSIAVWGGDDSNPHGHVAYVEDVIGDNVIINEANVHTYNHGGGYDGKPKTINISQMEYRKLAGNLKGYLYLNIANESINTSSWTAVSGIDFDGGDDTTYMTGWKHIAYDVSGFAGRGPITLRLHVWDRGDSIYDTAVLIDNIKLE